MTRTDVIRTIKAFGFKQWGKLRRYKGSSYQCFRNGNHYAWIGYRYIEIDTEAEACDFVGNSTEDVRKYIMFACDNIGLGDK